MQGTAALPTGVTACVCVFISVGGGFFKTTMSNLKETPHRWDRNGTGFRMEVSEEDTATDPPVNSLPWLDNLLRQKCGIPSLYPHQLAHGKDLNDGRELFLVIATGLGKSIVLFAPLIAAQARQERGIAFMIVPTKAEVGRKYGLKAIAINEDPVGKLTHATDAISLRNSLEATMLQGRRIGKLLNDPKFKVLVRWMLIDEAHVLDEDSGTFREPYRSILHMRPRVPSNTVWGATTGTATPSAALRIAAALGFRTGQYVNARYTIDRPNIKYIPRFFQHPTSGFEFMDLSFPVIYFLQLTISADEARHQFPVCKPQNRFIPPSLVLLSLRLSLFNLLLQHGVLSQLSELQRDHGLILS
ncbi:hypothetical protein B0H13DRAFT_1863675 [Mycena leptocephala]|nr:hypothetical protein B0H13DRAFT_1863675 [Mycena leptocephala]